METYSWEIKKRSARTRLAVVPPPKASIVAAPIVKD
jgi:hypothetical protein